MATLFDIRKRRGGRVQVKVRDAPLGAAVGQAAGDRLCAVCTARVASYLCPQCQIAYCGASCYQAHGERCTEAFHRRLVCREMNLGASEERSGLTLGSGSGWQPTSPGAFLEALKGRAGGGEGGGGASGDGRVGQVCGDWRGARVYRAAARPEDDGSDSGGGGGGGCGVGSGNGTLGSADGFGGFSSDVLSLERLEALRDALEGSDDDDDDDDDGDCDDGDDKGHAAATTGAAARCAVELTAAERRLFLRAVASGSLTSACLGAAPWEPWWSAEAEAATAAATEVATAAAATSTTRGKAHSGISLLPPSSSSLSFLSSSSSAATRASLTTEVLALPPFSAVSQRPASPFLR